jgi:hypothetical protein
LSISGLSWIKLLLEKKFSTGSFNKTALEADGIVLNFKQLRYAIQCGHIYLSIHDSVMVADSLKFLPLITDAEFFAQSKFRNTRYRLLFPRISVNGLIYGDLLFGDNYRARSINICNAYIDILVDMDKPYDTKSPDPLMPYESLSSLKDTLSVDSLQILDNTLHYNESYEAGAKPAAITFDKIQAFAERIVNHSDKLDTIVIHAQGNIMNAALIRLSMMIPLGSPEFCFSYSGSLERMEANSLNKFLEIAENQRINTGLVQSASYRININSGRATGYVDAEYSDLSISVINKYTGSEKGIFNRISSFITKTFIIKANNLPNKSGSMRTGVVRYTRKPDETFIQFLWFALRSGVSNIIGL